MKRDDLIGKRIQYRKSDPRKAGNRNGWTGTITAVEANISMSLNFMIEVTYDNGVVQPYSIEALEGFGVPRTHPDCAGYLKFIGERDMFEHKDKDGIPKPTHFVKGENGGPTISCYSEEEAHETAKFGAQASKSGQAYLVMKITSKYQRAEPPVERIDL